MKKKMVLSLLCLTVPYIGGALSVLVSWHGGGAGYGFWLTWLTTVAFNIVFNVTINRSLIRRVETEFATELQRAPRRYYGAIDLVVTLIRHVKGGRGE